MWVAPFFGDSHCFHSARQAQLIRIIESIPNSNANHVWTACINGGALLTPCCWELCRAVQCFSPMSQLLCVISGNLDSFRGFQGVARLSGSNSTKKGTFILPAALLI